MEKNRRRAIRRHHRARLLKSRGVYRYHAEAMTPYLRIRWGVGAGWWIPTREERLASLRSCMVDEGRRRNSHLYRGGAECPCWSMSYVDRAICKGCIWRSRWKAGEGALDADYE